MFQGCSAGPPSTIPTPRSSAAFRPTTHHIGFRAAPQILTERLDFAALPSFSLSSSESREVGGLGTLATADEALDLGCKALGPGQVLKLPWPWPPDLGRVRITCPPTDACRVGPCGRVTGRGGSSAEGPKLLATGPRCKSGQAAASSDAAAAPRGGVSSEALAPHFEWGN